MNKYLSFTVFISGMVTLAVELTASRLLGAVFGTSNLVWASIIGLILIYLAAGYFIGGKLADRSPSPKTLFTILNWAAFSAGAVPLIAKPVLPVAAAAFDSLSIGVLAGSFVAVLVLFSVPITLLGTISPFAIRLLIDLPEKSGEVAGRVYGLSTLGSFIGTFLPVLFFIPLFGTSRTFLVFSLLLMGVAFVGLARSTDIKSILRYVWMPVLLVLAYLIWADIPLKRTEGQVFETESAYNYIEVLEENGYTYLRLNEGQGVHSIYHPENLNYYGPWELFLAAPFFVHEFRPDAVERIGIVGLAGGTIARQATDVFGPVPIDGWEIDPKIIEVGRLYFDMNMPNLNAIAQDGRLGLNQSSHRYTLIAVDAYRPPYIPWHLTTKEFFEIVNEKLEPGGVAVINVGRSPSDRSLIDGLVGTMSSVFENIFVIDVPNSFNTVVIATNAVASFSNFVDNFQEINKSGAGHPLLIETMVSGINNIQETPFSETVFTDDRAPIEWLTNNLVLSYLVGYDNSGGLE